MTNIPTNLPVANGRALAVARALRQAARKFRNAGAGATARGNVVVVEKRWEGTFGRAIFYGFLAVFVLPVLVSSIYFGIFASKRYVSTTQFTVRSGQELDGLLGGLSAVAQTQQPSQNMDIVANYIDSNDMITVLSKKLDLRAIYSRPSVDFFSRADPDEPIEKFNRYWNNRVVVNVDRTSYIVTVSVQAFTPEDALAIARGVLQESERLVNQMSDRARHSALQESITVMTDMQKELDGKTRLVRDLRNSSGLLDPQKTGDVAVTTLGSMQTALSDLRIEYSTQLRWVSPDAPQMRILTQRIANTQSQIKDLENQVASARHGGTPSLADSSAQFDKANLDLTLAQQQYVASVAAVEKARNQLEEQLVYVLPFEDPTLPEEALYPRRFLTVFSIAGICLAIWGAVVGLALLARNNLAI